MDLICKASSERSEVSTDSGRKANVLGSRMSTGRVVRVRPLVLRFRVPVLGAEQPGSDECHRQSECKIIMFITCTYSESLICCPCATIQVVPASTGREHISGPSASEFQVVSVAAGSSSVVSARQRQPARHRCVLIIIVKVIWPSTHTQGRATCSVDCTAMCRVKRLARAEWGTGLFVLALHVYLTCCRVVGSL